MDENMKNTVTNGKTPVHRLQEQGMDQIDLMDIAFYLLSKAWIIVLSAVICAAVVAVWTMKMVTPMYTTSSMIYINARMTLSDLQLGTELTSDYMVIGKSHEVMDEIIEELDLNMSAAALSGMIDLSNPSGSHIMKITVTSPDPQLSADISNTTAQVLRQRISDIVDTDMPSVVENALVPSHRSSPNTTKSTAKGGLLGGALAVAVLILLYLMDDTIHNEDDVERYLGLNTLAAIPYERRPGEKRSNKKRNSSHRRGKEKVASA